MARTEKPAAHRSAVHKQLAAERLRRKVAAFAKAARMPSSQEVEVLLTLVKRCARTPSETARISTRM